MSDIQQKLEDYLNDNDTSEYYPEEDVDLMDKMLEFIMSLSSDNLSDDQLEEVIDIVDQIADGNIDEIFDEDEDVDEAISRKKVKISPGEKRRRSREYRKKRPGLKLKGKRYRRTTAYKRWQREKKRRARSGKTARGKRLRKFL